MEQLGLENGVASQVDMDLMVGIIFQGGAAHHDRFHREIEEKFQIRPLVTVGFRGKYFDCFLPQEAPMVIKWLFDERVDHEVYPRCKFDQADKWFEPILLQ